jgi:hypothetical protein
MSLEDNRLKKFEGSLPWRIVRPKNEEVTQGWRKARNLFFSSNFVRTIYCRMMRCGRYAKCLGAETNACNILI